MYPIPKKKKAAGASTPTVNRLAYDTYLMQIDRSIHFLGLLLSKHIQIHHTVHGMDIT